MLYQISLESKKILYTISVFSLLIPCVTERRID
jgi:hypothetical protein